MELEELKESIENNEMQIKLNIIADFEERMRKSDELWQKKLDLRNAIHTRDTDTAVRIKFNYFS